MDLKPKQTEWDLSPLLSGDDDPTVPDKRREIEKVVDAFVKKWESRTDYLKDPEVLAEALDEYESWIRNYGGYGDEGYYFHLRTAQDSNNPKLKAKQNKISEFSQAQYNKIQFFELRIAKIDEETQKKMLAFPNLNKYKHFLERIFKEAKHLLSESEEKIMRIKETTSLDKWIEMTEGFLAKEQRKVLTEEGKIELRTESKILPLLKSKDRKVRDSAFKALVSIFSKHSEVAENELNAILYNKKQDDELRKFTRPDEDRHIADDIDSEVVDALVKTVTEAKEIGHRYFKLKAQILGLKSLRFQDKGIDITPKTREYTYEEAIKLVNKVFLNLDPEFSEIFEDYVNNSKIDVYPRVGKVSGAFCTNPLISQSSYVLMNYNNKLSDVLTIAHEMGHAINHTLIAQKQNALSASSLISTAEVASTFMQDFVLEEILKDADPETRFYIQLEKAKDDFSYIFAQIGGYRLEQAIHSKFRSQGYLSKEEFSELYKENMSAFYGPVVKFNPGSELWWVSWTHIRMFFYVYSYSSGLLISKALQRMVRNDPKSILKVKEFLSAGSAASPKDTFAKLGIDITNSDFWKEGLAEVEELITSLEKSAKDLKLI